MVHYCRSTFACLMANKTDSNCDPSTTATAHTYNLIVLHHGHLARTNKHV